MSSRSYLRMLSVGELQILCGLAAGRTQAEIGEGLHLEQSTVSKTLRACEGRLGLEIVTLTGRRLGLSDAGRTLAVAAQRALDALDDLDGFIDALREGRAGSVCFATSSTPGSYVLPPLVAAFLRERPDVSIDMQIIPVSELWERFDSERFDFAIAPELGRPQELRAEALYNDPVVFFAKPGTPIAARKTLSLSDLSDQTLVGKFIDVHWRSIFRVLERRGFRAKRKVVLIPPEGVKRMVAEGLGVGALFESSIARELQEGSLVRLPISDPSLEQVFCIASRRESLLSPTALAFLRFLEGALHG